LGGGNLLILTKERLNGLDEFIYKLLEKNVDIMPIRFIKFIANNYTDARIRKIYLEKLGVVMGEGTYTNLGFRIVSDDYEKRLFIGNNVSIAPNVTFVCMSSANNGKEINDIPYIRDILTKSQNILVEDEVWIGANVTVLPGVHIGKCTVVGAGSVVVTDVEPYSIYVGVPAKKIRSLID
jgi:maltose O-acetyltransferase